MKFSRNDAIVQGYTQEVFANGDCCDLELLVKPGTDFDDTFRAYCLASSEWLDVNGWLYIIEPASDCFCCGDTALLDANNVCDLCAIANVETD